jgi:predicted transcriptional regulator
MPAQSASLFDSTDDAMEAAAIARARADFATGQTVAHAEVVAWLQSWGTAGETPAPQPPHA